MLSEWIELVNLSPARQGVGFGGLEKGEMSVVGEEGEVEVLFDGVEGEAGIADVVPGGL